MSVVSGQLPLVDDLDEMVPSQLCRQRRHNSIRPATDKSTSRSGSGPVGLLEQGHEAGLLEMLVSGQRFADPLLLHDDEGNAIGERPRFVGTTGEQVRFPRSNNPNRAGRS